MFVVVIAVGGVTMTVVDVIDMITVRYSDVTTTLTMSVPVRGVGRVLGRFTLVVVTLMGTVQMTVVDIIDIIDVIAVRYRDVTATLTVGVAVVGVLDMHARHDLPASWNSTTVPRPSSAAAADPARGGDPTPNTAGASCGRTAGMDLVATRASPV